MVPNKASAIKFHYITTGFSFAHRSLLKQSIVALFNKERSAFSSLDYIFCDDNYLLQINKDFLNHDTLTDIITFNLSADRRFVMGEVYISVERVKENAAIFTKSFKDELSRVIFHGALHLCGYTDKTPVGKEQMRSKEDEYIDAFKNLVNNVPRGTNNTRETKKRPR